MSAQASVHLLRRSIAVGLVRYRDLTGYKVSEVAERTGVPASRISQFEGKHRLPSDELAVTLLEFYEVPADERTDFLARLSAARRPARTETTASDPQEFELFAGLEAGASCIESFSAMVLHGLVQTPAYAEALLRGHDQELPEGEVRRRLRMRLGRQAILEGPAAARLWMVIPEHVLSLPVGGPDVMRDQLAHLRKLGKRPNVDIQVIPRDVVPHHSLHGPFTILSFDLPNDPGVVYVETRIRGIFFEQPGEIQEYRQVLNQLRVQAASQAESGRIIDAVRKGIT